MDTYEGRLELTWTNKHLSLLAQEDGSYEWVPPSDYRVAEIRLLHDAGAVGDVGKVRVADNLLIIGDALNALTSLARLPEFASQYLGKVKLAYIDPPFNTQQAFLHYDDALEHSVWLTMMRDRLKQAQGLLSGDGSVWVHCDDSEQAYLRALMDELFGRQNFIATVVWEKSDSPRMDAQYFSGRHDYILVYAASEAFRLNRLGIGDVQAHYNKVDEAGVNYYLKPLRAMGPEATRDARPTLFYPLAAPDGSEVLPKLSDGSDGRWRWKRDKVKRDADLIEWVKTEKGWSPYFRVYDRGRGRPPETIWPHTEVGSNRTSKREIKQLFPSTRPFDTPKPEALMRRIIEIASDPGDVVVDWFLGSATTAAVAHKMGRRWIGIEQSRRTLEAYACPRLSKVVKGEDPGGMTDELDWVGGGGFRVLEVAPSMFSADQGMVFLADWMTNGALAEATAAQLGFAYESDPPFAGKKGRSRLAVVDGVVNEDVVRLLATALPEGERVVVCGTGIDTEARPILRDLRPGSTLRKIPAALLQEYRSASQLSLIPDEAGPSPDGQPNDEPDAEPHAATGGKRDRDAATAIADTESGAT
jgi:adenine-specific DNA-methyltransferase